MLLQYHLGFNYHKVVNGMSYLEVVNYLDVLQV